LAKSIISFQYNIEVSISFIATRYLGIITRRVGSWADPANYTVQKAWKALHFIMRVLKWRKE